MVFFLGINFVYKSILACCASALSKSFEHGQIFGYVEKFWAIFEHVQILLPTFKIF